MFFLVLKPQCTAKWHEFYIRNRHISVCSFVYKYDQWPHDSYMIERSSAWEPDDIVSSILYSPSGTSFMNLLHNHFCRFTFCFYILMAKQTNRRKRSVFNETHLQRFFSKIEELRNYVKKKNRHRNNAMNSQKN